jgi:class 3 adenylate cyclase
MRPETRYALSGEVHVAYQVTGTGPVDLVWAPGTVSHLELDWEWPAKERFIERLSRFCRLIRFDKRGTGLSDRVTDAATLEERTDDIRAVMDAAGSDRAFVMGVSEGANMGCLFAATYPDRTRGLLIWGGQARWVQTPDYPWGSTPQENAKMIADLAAHGVTVEYLTGGGAGAPADAALLAFFVRYWRSGASPSAMAALERMNTDVDVGDILGTIDVPTLVMNATDDRVAHIDAARDLASKIPGARFVAFPGGHLLFADEDLIDLVLPEIEEFVTGERGARTTDRVLATILFTDIVGSTSQVATLGDERWREMRAAHHEAVRRELERFRGREVDTAGDGFFATFDGPGRAIRCARAIGAAVRRLGLEVRAGVHTGECEIRGAEVSGIAVHIGARVMALAGPSEVLVSQTVKDLVAGSGITFEDQGEHALKGVPGPWRIHRVAAAA